MWGGGCRCREGCEVGVVRYVWRGECGCVWVSGGGVSVGRWVWVWRGGMSVGVGRWWVWGVRRGCDVGGCGRWVQVMEHVKIEGVEM